MKIKKDKDNFIKTKFMLNYFYKSPPMIKEYIILIDNLLEQEKYITGNNNKIIFKVDLPFLLNMFGLDKKRISKSKQMIAINFIFSELKKKTVLLPVFKKYRPEKKYLKLVEFTAGPVMENKIFEFHIHKDLKFLVNCKIAI